MKKQDWDRFAAEFHSRLNGQGVFLSSEASGRANTMTISWGSVGVYWGRPVVTAPVRLSRYTHELIEKTGVFTVSIPRKGEMSKQLAYAGSKSGRDGDKFAAMGLTARPGRQVPAPVVGEAWMHIECRVLCKYTAKGPDYVEAVDREIYPDGNYHTYYLGEVVDFYEL
jgi:flavin reductase (DIM6/NTAB) family NADH-FMN oxidoreductase RutF